MGFHIFTFIYLGLSLGVTFPFNVIIGAIVGYYGMNFKNMPLISLLALKTTFYAISGPLLISNCLKKYG